jgi:hypothetical protein
VSYRSGRTDTIQCIEPLIDDGAEQTRIMPDDAKRLGPHEVLPDPGDPAVDAA